MLDMQAIGADKEALLNELRTAGAVLSAAAAEGSSNFCCPYHQEKTPSARIKQGDDHRWRFCCYACGIGKEHGGVDVLDLQEIRTGRTLREIIREDDRMPRKKVDRSAYRPGPRPETSDNSPDQTSEKQPTGAKPAPAHGNVVYDTLDMLKKAVEFVDAKALQRDFPDFDRRRVLAKTFPYSDPDTSHLDLIAFRLEGSWEEAEGTPKRKSCLQGHETADGHFVLKRPPGLAPLFNRQALLNAAEVVVVEGEPKVVVLQKLGIVATCSPGGSNAAGKADWNPLNGKKLVIIWRDKDKLNKAGKRPGLEYQNDVITELNKLPQPPLIKTVDVNAIDCLPEDGSDVVDLVKQMGDLPDEQKAEVIRGYLDSALPTGAHAELLGETEEILCGTRNVVDWPWKTLASVTEAITSGKATVVCGPPGSSKSLFVLQAMYAWFSDAQSCALLQLEDGVPYHLRRAAAMAAGCSRLTSPKWQREHPEETRKMVNFDMLTAFGRCLHDTSELPNREASIDNLLRWLDTQVQRGTRIVGIDPVTLADFGKDIYSEDSKLIRGIKRIFEGSMSSFIAVTHPRPGSHGKTLDNLSLTRGWGNFTPTALWYEFVKDGGKKRCVKTVSCSAGEIQADLPVNRIVHVLKSRNTGGAFTRIAFDFDNETLKVSELGILVD